MSEMSATEALALGKSDGLLGGGSGVLVLILALFFMMFGGGMWGNRGPAGPAPASADQVAQGFTNQQLQQIALSSANNNYETAQLINGQTNALMQQNNANLVNAIQGFNNLGLQIQNQTNVLTQQLMGMQAKLDSCCCEIKTQMLQYRLADAEAKNVAQANEISNFQQSQYILSQMGRFVAWAGSGSQTAAAAA